MKSVVTGLDAKSIVEKTKDVKDVGQFFKGKFSGKQDVKTVLSAVSVSKFLLTISHVNLC